MVALSTPPRVAHPCVFLSFNGVPLSLFFLHMQPHQLFCDGRMLPAVESFREAYHRESELVVRRLHGDWTPLWSEVSHAAALDILIRA